MNQVPIRRKPTFYETLIDPRFRIVTIMTAILGLIAVVQLLTGMRESVIAGALIKPFVRQGQWWRMLTCAFLHGSALHILFNGLALYRIGKLLEFLTNRGSLLLVYFLSVISGSTFSMIFMPEATSLGASGGIIGLFGFLAVLAYKRRSFMPPGFLKSILQNLIIIAVIGGIAHNYIDNASHAGGLLAGIIAGWFLVPDRGMLPIRSSKFMKWIGNVLFGFYILCGLFSLYMIAFVHLLI